VDEPKIKGASIRECLLWHDRRYGHEETLLLTERLPPHLLAMLHPAQPALGILGASWYPCTLVHNMCDRLLELRGGGDGRELALAANREVMPRIMHGMYRMVLRTVGSPELYAHHVQRLWRRLHTTGERSITLHEPDEAFSVVENWPGHHPLLCWLTIYTMAYMFETMGYKRWSVERVACVSQGGARCETLLRYRR
jgi:hypothetical protein